MTMQHDTGKEIYDLARYLARARTRFQPVAGFKEGVTGPLKMVVKSSNPADYERKDLWWVKITIVDQPALILYAKMRLSELVGSDRLSGTPRKHFYRRFRRTGVLSRQH